MTTRVRSPGRKMRRSPAQQRSRATVEVIVEAATRVLSRRGWSGFTTNEVAAVAGVSIGSLYQYFHDKHALADAVRRRHLDAVLSVVRESAAARDPELRVRRLVECLFAIHSDPRLHGALLDEVPGNRATRTAQREFEAEYYALYEQIIGEPGARGGRSRRATVARVLAAAMEGVVHAIARGDFEDATAARRELVTLASGYVLQREARA